MAAVAALPFVFAAVLVVMEKPSLASAIGLGLAGALALHAGHPQLTYYTAVFACIWCAVRLVSESRSSARAAARVFVALLAGGALAVGLSAYRLLPLAAELRLVTRSNASGAFLFGSSGLAPAGLLTEFHPEYHGSPLNDSFAEGWDRHLLSGCRAHAAGGGRIRDGK